MAYIFLSLNFVYRISVQQRPFPICSRVMTVFSYTSFSFIKFFHTHFPFMKYLCCKHFSCVEAFSLDIFPLQCLLLHIFPLSPSFAFNISFRKLFVHVLSSLKFFCMHITFFVHIPSPLEVFFFVICPHIHLPHSFFACNLHSFSLHIHIPLPSGFFFMSMSVQRGFLAYILHPSKLFFWQCFVFHKTYFHMLPPSQLSVTFQVV